MFPNFHRAIFSYLSIGPPVYFVVKNSTLNYSNPSVQDLIRGGSNPSSLTSQIFSASKLNSTYIAKPASSWTDDYIDWINNENCCKMTKGNHSFCPNQDNSGLCEKCIFHHIDGTDEVDAKDFQEFVSFFLRDNPGQECPKGGHAAYGGGVNLDVNNNVGANYFMTYHSVLKSSLDYTVALREARAIALNITNTLQRGTACNS